MTSIREIYIGDRLINQCSHKRNAIMVFQDYALFPHMNIGENIAYGLKLQKLTDNEITAKVEKLRSILAFRVLKNAFRADQRGAAAARCPGASADYGT